VPIGNSKKSTSLTDKATIPYQLLGQCDGVLKPRICT
jgi:hypothetical protein